MKVLVTGAGGFVGGHLCAHLAAAGDAVYATIWPVTAATDLVPRHGEAELIPCNILDAAGLAEIVRRVRPNGVIHLAGLAFVPAANRWPHRAYAANFLGAHHLLTAVKAHAPAARVVLVASSDVYGRVPAEQQPIAETAPLAPISPYGVSKAAADLLGQQFFLGEKLAVVRARPFNHTGPGQHPDYVVPGIAQQVARIETGKQEPVLRLGDTTVVRDFTDVREIVRGYRLLLEKGIAGEAYNLCSGRGTSIAELVEGYRGLAAKPFTVGTDPAKHRPSDLPRLVGDNAKVKRDTGWAPAIPLADTLRDTLAFWREKVR